MFIKPKPWWLKLTTKWYQWVTIHPNVYPSDNYWRDTESPTWLPVIQHEKVHLERQVAAGKWIWLARYAASKKFRLEEEVIAIVEELRWLAPNERAWTLRDYAVSLAGQDYMYAAPSVEEAENRLIERARSSGVQV